MQRIHSRLEGLASMKTNAMLRQSFSELPLGCPSEVRRNGDAWASPGTVL